MTSEVDTEGMQPQNKFCSHQSLRVLPLNIKAWATP